MREQFFLDPELAQFAAFVLSPHTRPLQAAIDGYRDRARRSTPSRRCSTGIEREDAVRAAAAAYAGGGPGAVRAHRQHHDGPRAHVRRADLSPGDEILTTTHDFYSTEDSLRLLADRTGARVQRVSLYDDAAAATVDQMVERLVGGITPRTKVVAVTWVHSSTGRPGPGPRDRRRPRGR